MVRPSFIVLDGRKGFTNGGPDEGDLATLDFMAAGSDPVAVDAVGLAFLRLACTNRTLSGGPVWSLPMMKRAAEIGVGISSVEQLVLWGLEPAAEASPRAQLSG